jgi:hypothetical protein
MPDMPEPYLNSHQTRLHEPTPYENLLGDGIEAAFRAGIIELPELVQFLNDNFVPSPGGAPWTEAVFTAEMRRLGA